MDKINDLSNEIQERLAEVVILVSEAIAEIECVECHNDLLRWLKHIEIIRWHFDIVIDRMRDRHKDGGLRD